MNEYSQLLANLPHLPNFDLAVLVCVVAVLRPYLSCGLFTLFLACILGTFPSIFEH